MAVDSVGVEGRKNHKAPGCRPFLENMKPQSIGISMRIFELDKMFLILMVFFF